MIEKTYKKLTVSYCNPKVSESSQKKESRLVKKM